jgi:hypothetical protein
MTRSRWKLAAGGLALSLGGLAAIAGVPARPGAPAHCPPPEPQVACGLPAFISAKQPQPPVELPPPAAEPAAPAAPQLPVPGTPPATVVTPAELPALPLPPVTEDKKVTPASGTAPAPMLPDAPKPTLPAPEGPKVAVPSLETPKPAPALPVPEPTKLSPAPAPAVPSPELPKPAPLTPTAGTQAPALPLTPQPEPPARTETPPPPPGPQPDAPPMAEKKLKVILQMGDERPRFEVRDGDEVYLKVVCDRVEVKSPSDKGEMMSTLKASGRAAFVTPGGEGVCDELTVVPGTGQVVVTGKVSFKYNWGKVETTVSGDRMTFRLGTAPGMATPTTIPASFNRTR